ncbi:unnamed protein product [Zymoseptoria tritici ST99CH_3D1]|uniref:Uncharacterized protein n=1 Tax=Zymoseptoria tritici (strain ST99CH_3D7) TaxID=1276538 RepID=A0A1X7RFS2_ZYMT9|nr:unnamed protein product [Zymoseptoria tritici ST99CH_3D7]SMR44779.1 unnamed protein product [Zymoseptoria tritici ST99CH_3D1]
MKDSLLSSLYSRELSDPAVRSRSYRKLYSSSSLINDLDITQELGGHSGCVNALSWSKSGHYLASGSDDQHLNIHHYQGQGMSTDFRLACTVATGHTQNIFSAKFMPYSNDKTVVTAAGDGEVRVFDLEYAGQTREASRAATLATQGRRRGRNIVYNGVKYLSDGDTDCRVYRSHGDRVKRIVTESSPHLFLTCSEDGEVRQFDLRLPSSAYPSARAGRPTPPPLISYKRFGLDLNTISCSPSQPHYIALGGAHLHAFLHDRRMTGRDRLMESGTPLPHVDSMSSSEQDLMSQATQCVRKFAPKGQRRMKRQDSGHITACKISDARPDEMIVSWSGDHIYSFDLIRDLPVSAGDPPVAENQRRKRKRRADGSDASMTQTVPLSSQEPDRASLRIRYRNGQSEDIQLSNSSRPGPALTDRQTDARQIAKGTVALRASLFGPEHEEAATIARFTTSLGEAASILGRMDEAMREWRYPMDPEQDQVYTQQILREKRESSRRFVQAAGTIARVLGGRLQTPAASGSAMAQFAEIEVRTSDRELPSKEQFRYDFLRAILLWLDSGIGQLIDGFTRPSDVQPTRKQGLRLPIPEAEATTESIDEYLVPYLLSLANDHPVVDLDTNRFEVDESRHLFPTEVAAVRAFAEAVKIPFADISSAIDEAEGSADQFQTQDRQVARKFWAHKVARGILLSAAEELNYVTVDRAFGGLGRVVREDDGNDLVQGPGPARVGVDSNAGDDDHDDDQDESSDVYDDDDNDNDGFDDESDDGRSTSSSEPDEEDGVPNLASRYIYRSAMQRRQSRHRVEADTPCSKPTRQYRGHCNVRTVKDVNYFGPEDQYVVSGSDDGNFFIWDRRTGELLNVLEGDGEVVNVIQGHPYETMLAVSGIDHTIKIFSPDARAREAARRGIGVSAHDPSSFSSLAWPMRIGRRQARSTAQEPQSEERASSDAGPALTSEEQSRMDHDDEYVAATGLSSRKRMHDVYRITQTNEMEREGGNQDSAITLPHAQLLRLLFGQLGNAGMMPTFE